VSAVPRTGAWKRPAVYVLCVLGIGISGYLTAAHYTQGVMLACPTVGVINCERVTSSPQSTVGPVPVPILGLVWFAVLAGLVAAPGTGAIRTVRAAWALGGLGFVFYLIYAELFLVGSICLWCTAVHVLVFALCLIMLAGLDNGPDADAVDIDAEAARPG
jgi:uncharacterized membrane protein